MHLQQSIAEYSLKQSAISEITYIHSSNNASFINRWQLHPTRSQLSFQQYMDLWMPMVFSG